MIPRAALAGIASILLAACAGTSARRADVHLSAAERGATDRMIIVTVPNLRDQFAQRAGSTPRAYDGLQPYAVSAAARSAVEALARQYRMVQVAAWPIEPLAVHCVVFKIPDDVTRSSLLDRLSKDRRLASAQPMQDFESQSGRYNDPYVALQRGFARMDVADAQQWSTGTNVRVAIIDTGVDTTHPDLSGRIMATKNFVDADELQFNRDRHGTEVAGVVAAVANNREGIVGVAPGVRLIVLKACWQLDASTDRARCNSLTLAQALVAAMELHAQIVNLSLSGPADPLLSALIEQAGRRGIVFVGAAPAQRTELEFPAGVITVIGVSSATASAEAQPPANADSASVPGLISTPRLSSAPGLTPMPRLVFAPGSEILTLLPGKRYDFVSGVSFATAHVTGTIALLLAQNPQIAAADIARILKRSSAAVATDHGSETTINACEALAAVDSRVICPPAAALYRDDTRRLFGIANPTDK